jgi:hypothetical protein
MASRLFYVTPSGGALTVVTCSKTIFLRGRRIAVATWSEQLPTIDDWLVATYAESETSLWLHAALAGMWSSTNTGGLWHNLKRARDSSVLYKVQWDGPGLRVALCDQHAALEGGLGNLIKNDQLYRRGLISIPPAITAMREIRTAFPDVEAIMLPASPKESNSMRLALARVLLVRPQALARLEAKQPVTLVSPHRLLPALVRHRAPDRMSSLEDPPGRKLWAAPRLAYFLAHRSVAQAKDWLRRAFVEKPKASLASVRDFMADRPEESTIELLRAIGYLIRAVLEGWAAILVALALLIGALSRAGLL